MERGRGETATNRRVSLSPRPRATKRRLICHPPVITLLTDFGLSDYFVGAVKGAILAANSEVRIVDLTHEIPAHDIEAGAFTLLASYKSFPQGTIHLAVVDPGVGSSRRGICVVAAEQIFVGPDNGLFSYIYEREPAFTVFELTNKEFFRETVSSTFHGRDLFAPVAAALSKGVKPSSLGKIVRDPVVLKPLAPQTTAAGRLVARIIHIDRFGNCITNITTHELTPKLIKAGAQLVVNGKTIRSFRKFFSEAADHEKLFCIWGSAGFLEIAAANTSAAKLLKVQTGAAVVVTI